MFESRHLRTFRVVVRTGSYSSAARELGYTQPAISHQMRQLENAAGTPLFTRAGRSLRLTEAGEMLARHTEHILDSLAYAEEQIAAVKRLRAGRVRVCTFPSASATIVSQAVARLSVENPGVRVELVDTEPPESLCALQRGECDVTLAFDYPDMADAPALAEQLPPEDAVTVPLLDDPVMVLLPRGHPLRRKRGVRLADLADERWIAGCPRCRTHFVQLCAQAGFDPDITFTTDDNLAVQSLVAAGVGIAAMPGLVLSFLRHPQVAALRIEPVTHRRVVACTLKDYVRIPAVRLLLETLRSTAEQLAPGADRPTVGVVGGF
ncbi:LysR family transcriptional regulator [Streptomyces sp. NPDC003077]|uniref:LysR family transcriptional regulator n=1 Tax=Streptomyces sp. NPDC003077 TaxID=3154443 RepID=UPI0033BABAB0